MEVGGYIGWYPGFPLHEHTRQRHVPVKANRVELVFNQLSNRTPAETQNAALDFHRQEHGENDTCNLIEGIAQLDLVGNRLDAVHVDRHVTLGPDADRLNGGAGEAVGDVDGAVHRVEGMQTERHSRRASRVHGRDANLLEEVLELKVDAGVVAEILHDDPEVRHELVGLRVLVGHDRLEGIIADMLLNQHGHLHVMLDVHHLDVGLVVVEDQDVVVHQVVHEGVGILQHPIPVEAVGNLEIHRFICKEQHWKKISF